MVEEIVEYIAKCRSHGLADDLIHSNLITAGWDENSIRESFASFESAQPSAETANTSTKPRSRLWLKVGMAILLLALVGAGFVVYSKMSFSPDDFWAQALTAAQNQNSGTMQFTITYHENVPTTTDISGRENLGGALTLQAVGSSKYNKNGESLNSEFTSIVTSTLGDFNYELEIESRKIGDQIFYKIASDMLNTLSTELGLGNSNANEKWYRENIASDPGTQNALQSLTQIELLFKNADFMRLEEYIDTENIDGEEAAHYRANVDPGKLAEYLSDTYFAGVADKLSFDPVEIWIGRNTGLVRRVKLGTNFPTFVSGNVTAQKQNAAMLRDKKRLGDIYALKLALEQYKTTNKRYPQATSGLPDLLEGVPFAPKPADGICTLEQNLYWYEQQAAGQSYQLKFCLGDRAGGYGPGVHTISETSVVPSSTEPDIAEARTRLADLPFTGKLELEINFSGAGADHQITVPPNAILEPNPIP